MFRNQYDNDVTTWSPQGRLHQVEYAMEAVKQGSAIAGLKSKTHAVLVALKRASNDLAACQKKILPIDEHVGFGIAGLTADARIIGRYMRTECLNNRYVYETALPVNRMIIDLGNKMQTTTQRYDKRPYGVGLLVIGYDEGGPHLYQTCPSSAFFDCKAMAIGARSQSARTYMEKNLDTFLDCTLEELIKHGLKALRDTLPNDSDLTTRNTTIAAVGKDMNFTVFDGEDVAEYLRMIEGEERGRGAPPGADEPPALRPESPQAPPRDPEVDVAMETE